MSKLFDMEKPLTTSGASAATCVTQYPDLRENTFDLTFPFRLIDCFPSFFTDKTCF